MDVLEYRMIDGKWTPVGLYRLSDGRYEIMFVEDGPWAAGAREGLEYYIQGSKDFLAYGEYLIAEANGYTVYRTRLPESEDSLEDVFAKYVGGNGVKEGM